MIIEQTTFKSQTESRTKMRVWHFIAVVILYLAIVQGIPASISPSDNIAHAPTSIENIVRSIIIPLGLAAAFTLIVVSMTGAWKGIFTNSAPVKNWLIAFPILLFITTIVITNYPGLKEKGLEFTLLLLVSTLMVGFAEELMFRGLGLFVFRKYGYSEYQAGLWTTVIFGLAHATNIFTAGPSALIQVVATAGTGLIFYFIIRRTGSLVAAMAAHGLWDFSVLSSQIDTNKSWAIVNVAGFVLFGMLIGLYLWRNKIVPEKGLPLDHTS